MWQLGYAIYLGHESAAVAIIIYPDQALFFLPKIFIFILISLQKHMLVYSLEGGVVGWCKGAVYLSSPGRPTDIGLQLGKACYPCSG